MKSKLLAAAALLMLLGAAPARADITYAVGFFTGGTLSGNANWTGYITTNGDIGDLQPEDILSWELRATWMSVVFSPPVTLTIDPFGSATGGTFTFTPTSLTATAQSIIFHTIMGSASFEFRDPDPLERVGISTTCNFGLINCLTPVGVTLTAPDGSRITMGPNDAGLGFTGFKTLATVPVPGPAVGAGLPGLVIAAGGLLAWWRRRRA